MEQNTRAVWRQDKLLTGDLKLACTFFNFESGVLGGNREVKS